MNVKPVKTAVVGCGAISDIYLTNMIRRFEILDVTACCANHLEHAQAKADKYGIKAAVYEEILEDPSIELIVNLTPAAVHYDLMDKALKAGKHVYTEKTMTVSLEDAESLLEMAKAKGLMLGAAPDTFMSAAFQNARKAIDSGLIGEVTSCYVAANRDLNLLTSMFSFLLLPGGGICYDYGVYHLTALVSLLGPVKRVCGVTRNPWPRRRNILPASPDFGREMSYPHESQVYAILEFADGFTGTFLINGDSIIFDQIGFMIYGTKGILKLPDPNGFGGDVLFISGIPEDGKAPSPESIRYEFGFSDNSRGLGPAEMAYAIREGRKNRASVEMAYHVLEIITAIMKSNETGSFCAIKSTVERPQPLRGGSGKGEDVF